MAGELRRPSCGESTAGCAAQGERTIRTACMRPLLSRACPWVVPSQVCGALGMLPGQGSHRIMFATAPNSLEPNGNAMPLGKCSGWRPQMVPEGGFGYTNDDSERSPARSPLLRHAPANARANPSVRTAHHPLIEHLCRCDDFGSLLFGVVLVQSVVPQRRRCLQSGRRHYVPLRFLDGQVQGVATDTDEPAFAAEKRAEMHVKTEPTQRVHTGCYIWICGRVSCRSCMHLFRATPGFSRVFSHICSLPFSKHRGTSDIASITFGGSGRR